MIKHNLYSKGEKIHALINTTQEPNILIPVKAIIYDIKFDQYDPQYQIRIKKFHDNIYFLKNHLFGGRFIRDFNNKETRINAKRKNYNTVEELEDNLFNGKNWHKYLIVVDSSFCTRDKAELNELFKNLQSFFIELYLKQIFEFANRSFYKEGQYYFHTKGQYEAALKKFLGERYPTTPNWINELLWRPESDELDSAD